MLWDFSIGTTLAALLRTWPFIAARIVVYGAVALGYVIVTGMGATVGWGIGAFGDDGFRAGTTFFGGLAGFAIVSAFLYFVREWFLYLVKAGHIALLVEVLDGEPVPGSMAQIAHAQSVVKARFAEANVLFVVDQLIRGVVRAVSGIVDVVATILPVPGLEGLARFIRAVVRVAVGMVDEMILAYSIRTKSQNPFSSAQDALVLYAQNAAWILKNAVWIAIMVWAMAFILFLICLAPAAAIVYFLPGTISNFGFVFAIVFALCLKAAILEPFAIAALIQVYFRAIDGQEPRADWRSHLGEVSEQFRDLGTRAAAYMARPATSAATAGPGSPPEDGAPPSDTPPGSSSTG